jgi:hypothetical protein
MTITVYPPSEQDIKDLQENILLVALLGNRNRQSPIDDATLLQELKDYSSSQKTNNATK